MSVSLARRLGPRDLERVNPRRERESDRSIWARRGVRSLVGGRGGGVILPAQLSSSRRAGSRRVWERSACAPREEGPRGEMGVVRYRQLSFQPQSIRLAGKSERAASLELHQQATTLGAATNGA